MSDACPHPTQHSALSPHYSLPPSIAEAVAIYLDFAAHYRTPRTMPMLRSDLTEVARFLAARGVSLVTHLRREHVHAWHRRTRARPLAATTIARKVAHLRGWCAYLARRGWLSQNPASWLRARSPQRRRPVPAADVAALLAACADDRPLGLRDRALVEILYATGLRASEVVRLRVADIALDARQLVVPGRRVGQRILPLHDAACAALRRYLTLSRPGNPAREALFLSRRGTALRERDVRARIRALGRRAGLHGVTPEALRWQLARDMAARGADLRAIAQLLGHARLSSTRRLLATDGSPGR